MEQPPRREAKTEETSRSRIVQMGNESRGHKPDSSLQGNSNSWKQNSTPSGETSQCRSEKKLKREVHCDGDRRPLTDKSLDIAENVAIVEEQLQIIKDKLAQSDAKNAEVLTRLGKVAAELRHGQSGSESSEIVVID